MVRPIQWLRLHFINYRLRTPWPFVWRITLEQLLISAAVGIVLMLLIQPEGNSFGGPLEFACLAIIIAPVIETLLFQALPIAVGRWLRLGFWVQVLLSTLLFALPHIFTIGLYTGINAGVIGGFYLAFTYTHWADRSTWTAIWTTTVCHAIRNTVAVGLFLIGTFIYPNSHQPIDFNAATGPYTCFCFYTPEEHLHLFTIAFPDVSTRTSLTGDSFMNHYIYGPFQIEVADSARHQFRFDSEHGQLLIDQHSYDLKAGTIFIIPPNASSSLGGTAEQVVVPVDQDRFRQPLPKGGAMYLLNEIQKARPLSGSPPTAATIRATTAATSPATSAAGKDDAFFKVCETGTPQQVQAGIRASANVNAKDKNGMTPLMRAASVNPNPEVIAALVKVGAEIDAKDEHDMTPLMWAAMMNSHPEIIAALIRAGAEVNPKYPDGITPLMMAGMMNTSPEIVAALIKAGAKVNAHDNHDETPLMKAATYNPNPKVIAALAKAGGDIDAKNETGMTPLMCAAISEGNPEVIAALIKAGADVNAKDKQGKTALDYAREKKNSRAVAALEKAEAK